MSNLVETPNKTIILTRELTNNVRENLEGQGEKYAWYNGAFYALDYSSGRDNEEGVIGEAKLEKIIINPLELRKKKTFFQQILGVNPGVERAWGIDTDEYHDDYPCVFVSNGELTKEYRKRLVDVIDNHGDRIILSTQLLDLVFGPIEKQLMEVYNSFINSTA